MILRKAVAPCLLALVALPLAGCPTEPSGPPATAATTAPPPVLEYTGQVDKTIGCYSGVIGDADDVVALPLGNDGWWDFYFQGCRAFATETVALWDPPGGATGNAFQAPSGYKCKMSIDGTSDDTPYYTTNIGPADTGGWIFLESAATLTSDWDSPTTWRITCILV